MIENDSGKPADPNSPIPLRPPKDTKEATFMLFMQEVDKLREKFDLTSVVVIPTIITPGLRGPDAAATMAFLVNGKRPNEILRAATLVSLNILQPTAQQLSVMLTGKVPEANPPDQKVILDG